MEELPAALTPPDWVARTKLRPPLLRADLIRRPALLATLRRAIAGHRLTLISAPAGYGKTTALAALAAEDLGGFAWLTLDREDDDPARFVAGLLTSLRQRDPDFGALTLALLASAPDASGALPRLIGVLVNDLVTAFDRPLALILDDLHLLANPAIHAALDTLIERLPEHIHLVVATRADPPLALARLRARRQLAELRLDALRFSDSETDQLIAGLLGAPPATEQRALIRARTEGWVAGAVLLVGALAQVPPGAGRDALLRGFAARDRDVFAYLADEVLRGEDAATRDFLLDTAILDTLTPEACAAVTGRADAAATLDALPRRNLFVLTLDPARHALRYHQFFRDFLLQRLRQERPAAARRELHRRAAAVGEPPRAIGHLLAAEAWEDAAAAIERAGDATLAHGERATLQGWIAALPDDVRGARPRLALLLGLAAWDAWDVPGARAHLAAAYRDFAARGDEAGAGEAAVPLASCLIALADYEGAGSLLARASAAPLPAVTRAQLLLNRAWLGSLTGDTVATGAALDAALALAEGNDEPRILRLAARQIQSDFLPLPGGPARIERLIGLFDARTGAEPSPLRAYVRTVGAWKSIWRGERALVVPQAEEALAIDAQFGGTQGAGLDVIGIICNLLLARWHAFAGEQDAADAALARLFDGPTGRAIRRPEARVWLATCLFPLARVRLVQGRVAEARALLSELAPSDAPEPPDTALIRTLLGGHLALAAGDYGAAVAAFADAATTQARFPALRLYGLAELPLAAARLRAGDPAAALAILAPLLSEHERAGTLGALCWEDRELLLPLLRLAAGALPTSPAAALLGQLVPAPAPADGTAAARGVPVPDTGATLTPREVEVLRLIVAGIPNPAIADQLFISVHTVKRHVANLLAKLGVESRTRAAMRARDLGIA